MKQFKFSIELYAHTNTLGMLLNKTFVKLTSNYIKLHLIENFLNGLWSFFSIAYPSHQQQQQQIERKTLFLFSFNFNLFYVVLLCAV